MSNLEILGLPPSTYTRAIRMALEEKGVPYDFTVAPPHTPPVLSIHPFGKIPVMRHGDIELAESKAIATYIDRTFPGPRLFPEDPVTAARAEQWVSIINTIMDQPMVRDYVLTYVFAENGKPDRGKIDGAVQKMRAQFPVLEEAVRETGYLAGDSFTYADINLMVILAYLQQLPESSELLKASPALGAYYARHSQRPSFTRTIPQMAN